MFNNAFSVGDEHKLWFLHGPISTHLENYVVNIGYWNAERYKYPPNEQYKY